MEYSFKALDGKHYNLSPLTLGDLRQITHKAQYLDWEDFQALKDQLPPEDFLAESRRLLQEASRKRLVEDSPEVEAYRTSLQGVVFILYLSIRRNHNITYDQLADILNTQIVAEAVDKILALSGMADKSKKNKTAS